MRAAILHAESDNPTPDTVYVCGGTDASRINPWTCPLDPEVYSADQAAQLIHRPADADEWLVRLSGKSPSCLSGCNDDRCWAVCLRGAFIDMFGDECSGNYEYDFEEADDYWTGDVGHDTFVMYRDEVEAEYSNDSCAPRHVPWLNSWHGLVETIRQLERRSFWGKLPDRRC